MAFYQLQAVNDKSTTFIAMYDLTSGQLHRQFHTTASVTAVAITSGSNLMATVLNDGSMSVYDIATGVAK